jgi:signal transduction histidine kinase
MKRYSFRVIIIATIIFMVTLFSVISFAVFNIFLKQKLARNTEQYFQQMSLLRDQYYFTISHHDGKIIKSMLESFERDPNVLETYIVHPDLKVVHPPDHASLIGDTSEFRDLFTSGQDILIKSYENSQKPFYRVFINMRNAPACYACHAPEQKNLGIIVMDLANTGNQSVLQLTRRFGIYYTLFILFGIFILVGILHVKYIRKSLNQFRSTIRLINKGNLDMRLSIPEVQELGSLGRDFNEMVSTFEKTQRELQQYHQKELRSSQNLATIGEMSARIAHEIRNPVTGISRALEIIMSDMKDSENIPILEEIQRQANRVNQAISNLLRFSRSKDIQTEPADINLVIKSLVFFLQNQAHDKEIRFNMVLQPETPVLPFDRELIENVLMNLSFNAVESLPGSGTITFRTRYDQLRSRVVISVSDTGPGIPESVGRDIFKPFFTTRTKGTGLGLAISKDIIDKHQGEIWYENNKEGGCVFYIWLPVKQLP